MNTAHSTARPTCEYQPTIIETQFLFRRLALQLAFFHKELKRSWTNSNGNPITFGKWIIRDLFCSFRSLLATENAVPAAFAAVAAITSIIVIALLIERTATRPGPDAANTEKLELTYIDVSKPTLAIFTGGSGKGGSGRVGFQENDGEGSGLTAKLARGGGGGGNRNRTPPQVGELPPPSAILAPIPTSPPTNNPALPVAGMDIDPALWKDLKAPVYGDPNSTSTKESKGPGSGEGIGTNEGLGIGGGNGPGYGHGDGGNIGGGSRQQGCCGGGGGAGGGGSGVPFSGSQVEQRARLLLKPEPQYTEEARKNQITGTVVLRVVFSSVGDVVQIRATRTLPFGLTERAIAAARQIKFVPAMKGGQPVSVFMQLEYNFHLY